MRPAPRFKSGDAVLYRDGAAVWRVVGLRWSDGGWVYRIRCGDTAAVVTEGLLTPMPDGHGQVVDPHAAESECGYCGKVGRWASVFCSERHQMLWMARTAALPRFPGQRRPPWAVDLHISSPPRGRVLNRSGRAVGLSERTPNPEEEWGPCPTHGSALPGTASPRRSCLATDPLDR